MAFYQSIRWTARILSILIAGFFLLFIVGEGIFGAPGDRFTAAGLTFRVSMMFVSWLISFVGLGLGWKRELSGGAVAVAGFLCFVVIEGRVSFNPYVALFAFNGLLFLFAGWLRSKHFPEAGGTPALPTAGNV